MYESVVDVRYIPVTVETKLIANVSKIIQHNCAQKCCHDDYAGYRNGQLRHFLVKYVSTIKHDHHNRDFVKHIRIIRVICVMYNRGYK